MSMSGDQAWAKDREPFPDTIASLRDAAREIFMRSLAACSVEAAAHATCRRVEPPDRAEEGYVLALEGLGRIDLEHVDHVAVIAVGKAAGPTLRALLDILPMPPRCAVHGVLIAPAPVEPMPAGFAFFAGGHPLPNASSFAGARAALQLLRHLAQDAGKAERCLCFFLISGGASAMMELPLDESLSFSETIEFYQTLLHSGANIAEMNCVRKHFSGVKGGRLRAAAGAMRTITLAVSDVRHDQLDVLGSGPTLPDSSTVQDCQEVLDRFDLRPRLPPAVRSFFASERCVETPKPGVWESPVAVLLSSTDLARAAQRQAEAMGFHVVCDPTPDDWDYKDAAEYLLRRVRALAREHPRLCLISAGEVTVTMPPGAQVGTGGRNQQFALHLLSLLRGDDPLIVALSAGSDGVDGNSRAAGAMVHKGLLPADDVAMRQALFGFDASPLLERLGATVHTGATGNNLRDLRLLLAVRRDGRRDAGVGGAATTGRG